MRKILFALCLIIAVTGCKTPTAVATAGTKNETVVLLHGLCRSSGAMNKLGKNLSDQGYRVLNVDYPSRQGTVEELSDAIFDELENYTTEEEKIHFVTHSMGGIILRQHLSTHEIPNLGRVVMLAPPSKGSEVPEKLDWLPPFNWLNGPAGKELGTAADCLPAQLPDVDFELGIIAGDRSVNPILSTLIPGKDDGKVAVKRADTANSTDFRVMHVTHTFMMSNNQVIKEVLLFLSEGHFTIQTT